MREEAAIFEVENGVQRWRRDVECASSLSPREVDELEDHLRARVELEMELDAGLAPIQAFAIAQEGVGAAEALSREFAKAGKPRWRRWLVAGLAMFGASFLMPVIEDGFSFGPGPPDWMPGWEALLLVLNHHENPIELLSALSNGLAVATLLLLRRARSWKARWLTGLMTGATALNLYWPIWVVSHGDNPLVLLGIGYWAWVASFGCIASALRLRSREWSSAKVGRVVA